MLWEQRLSNFYEREISRRSFQPISNRLTLKLLESPKVSCHSDSDSSAFYTYRVTRVGHKLQPSHEHMCKFKWMMLLQCITKKTIIFNKGLWHLKEFYFDICLSNRKFKKLGDPLEEIVTVFVHKYNVIMPHPNMTSFDSRDRLPRRWLLHYQR